MPRGGKRPGAGAPKRKPEVLPIADKKIASQVLDSLGAKDWKHAQPDKDGKGGCECEVCYWRALITLSYDGRLRFDVLKYLTDRRDGKAVQTVNHLHDKPIEMNVTHSLGERFRIAMEKAEERVRNKR
jgi:hypothetical protein